MNAYKTRSPGKPIRMGWNIYRLCDQGEITQGFCLDDLVSVGAYTYDQVHEYGKRYTLMHEFLHELADGTTCVGDSAFPKGNVCGQACLGQEETIGVYSAE